MENPKHMENTLASSSGTVSPEDQGKNTTTESKCPVNHAASVLPPIATGGRIR